MTHDVCGPANCNLEKEFGEKAKIWDKEKLVIFPDHYIFTKTLTRIEMLICFVSSLNNTIFKLL